VPEGDSKVFKKNDDDDDDDDGKYADCDFLPAEECPFAENLVETLMTVHPNHHVSKHCQIVMNDMCTMILNRLFKHVLSNANGVLSKESVVAAVPALLHGELCKYAASECEKTSNPLFLKPLTIFATTFYPAVASGEGEGEGLLTAAKLLEYCVAEVFELAGNFSRDCHLETVHPSHIMNLGDDEIEACLLSFSCMGTAVKNNAMGALYALGSNTSAAYSHIFGNEKENHEYFCLVNMIL
jgi:hypothetical protein